MSNPLSPGIKVKAHPNFRLVSTMNDDASTFELPEYIHSRLQPQIWIDFPERDEEYQILKENLPFAEDRILELCDRFPAARACGRRALYGARRHQHRPLCHQAGEPRHRARARAQGSGNRYHRDRGRGSAAVHARGVEPMAARTREASTAAGFAIFRCAGQNGVCGRSSPRSACARVRT